MARKLDMKTVEQGVEDQEDWDLPRAAGCGTAQGYFTAKRMCAEEVAAGSKSGQNVVPTCAGEGMNSRIDANEEVNELIETLHRPEQRMEELTAGEVDTVADRDCRIVILRRAQEYMRCNEAAKQAALTNALATSLAVLDTHGLIVSVNEAWRRFGRANAIQSPGDEIGVNYLEVCDNAQGEYASQAKQAARGIRSVLNGEAKHFSMEYPCHSPTEQRWFLMTVTPLTGNAPISVVVMHLNITERRQTEEKHNRLAMILESTSDFIGFSDPAGRVLYLNRAARMAFGVGIHEDIAQIQVADLFPNPASHPSITEGIPTAIREGVWSGEIVLRARDGREIQVSQLILAHTLSDGKLGYLSTVMRDITASKQAEIEMRWRTAFIEALVKTSADAMHPQFE